MSTSLRRAVPDPNSVRPPGSKWIDQNRDVLPECEWVAADATGEVAREASFDGLMRTLKDRHIDPSRVTVAFISSDPI